MDLDISTEHVTETSRFDREPPYSREGAIELVTTSPIDTDPLIIADGIDRITVVHESDSTYLIHYQGYVVGYARVIEDGIREFGEHYLADEQGVPGWYLTNLDETPQQRPWWAPDSYDPYRSIECDRCATDVPVPELVTPGRADGDVVDWLCPDCWSAVRERWSPEWAHAGKADVHRAEYLDRTVGGAPTEADIDELVTLVYSDDEKAQMHALTALGRLIPERADDIVSKRPVLVEQLDSDLVLTRFGALSCLALLAEHDPDMGLPVVDDVVPLLDPSSDGGILEEGIRFVAALAEEYPAAVRDAVPNLVTLLQNDPPEEQKAVQALIEIADAEPDAVASVISDLHTYIKDEDASHRSGVIATLGYVAKDVPEAAEATIPTMIDLLDESADRTRANAVGVLADLSEEYPSSMLYDLETIAALVDDDDEYAQQNATYVLAQVAEQYPNDVEQATDVLIGALGAESEHTRISACRALGYTSSKVAVEPLEGRRDEDDSMEVQKTAGWALGQMGE